MRKFLSLYLSLSLAFMPLLSHAQIQVEADSSAHMQDYAKQQVEAVEAEMKAQGIKIYTPNAINSLSLWDALHTKDFIVDASSMDVAIFRIKSGILDMKKNRITFYLAFMESLNDTSSSQVTSITLETNVSAEAIVSRIMNSLQILKNEDKISKLPYNKKKTLEITTDQRMGGLIIGLLFLSSGVFLGKNIFMHNKATKPRWAIWAQDSIVIFGFFAASTFFFSESYKAHQKIKDLRFDYLK